MDKVRENIKREQQLDKFNIEKSVIGTEAYYINQDIQKGMSQDEIIEKAKSGVYKLTAENKKAGRVGQKYGESKKEDESSGSFKIGDVVKFVKKNDKNDIINGKIVNVDNDKVKFINTDFPDAGESSFLKESLSKYYNVSKVNSKESTEKKEDDKQNEATLRDLETKLNYAKDFSPHKVGYYEQLIKEHKAK